jgi:hypothetical protein
LGNLIALLSVSLYWSWYDLAPAYLAESFSRRVLWNCKQFPNLAVLPSSAEHAGGKEEEEAAAAPKGQRRGEKANKGHNQREQTGGVQEGGKQDAEKQDAEEVANWAVWLEGHRLDRRAMERLWCGLQGAEAAGEEGPSSAGNTATAAGVGQGAGKEGPQPKPSSAGRDAADTEGVVTESERLRLMQSFEASRVSLRLNLFHIFFATRWLDHIGAGGARAGAASAGPDEPVKDSPGLEGDTGTAQAQEPQYMDLDRVSRQYDRFHGRCTVAQRRAFVEEVERILGIQSWPEYLSLIGLTRPLGPKVIGFGKKRVAITCNDHTSYNDHTTYTVAAAAATTTTSIAPPIHRLLYSLHIHTHRRRWRGY